MSAASLKNWLRRHMCGGRKSATTRLESGRHNVGARPRCGVGNVSPDVDDEFNSGGDSSPPVKTPSTSPALLETVIVGATEGDSEDAAKLRERLVESPEQQPQQEPEQQQQQNQQRPAAFSSVLPRPSLLRTIFEEAGASPCSVSSQEALLHTSCHQSEDRSDDLDSRAIFASDDSFPPVNADGVSASAAEAPCSNLQSQRAAGVASPTDSDDSSTTRTGTATTTFCTTATGSAMDDFLRRRQHSRCGSGSGFGAKLRLAAVQRPHSPRVRVEKVAVVPLAGAAATVESTTIMSLCRRRRTPVGAVGSNTASVTISPTSVENPQNDQQDQKVQDTLFGIACNLYTSDLCGSTGSLPFVPPSGTEMVGATNLSNTFDTKLSWVFSNIFSSVNGCVPGGASSESPRSVTGNGSSQSESAKSLPASLKHQHTAKPGSTVRVVRKVKVKRAKTAASMPCDAKIHCSSNSDAGVQNRVQVDANKSIEDEKYSGHTNLDNTQENPSRQAGGDINKHQNLQQQTPEQLSAQFHPDQRQQFDIPSRMRFQEGGTWPRSDNSIATRAGNHRSESRGCDCHCLAPSAASCHHQQLCCCDCCESCNATTACCCCCCCCCCRHYSCCSSCRCCCNRCYSRCCCCCCRSDNLLEPAGPQLQPNSHDECLPLVYQPPDRYISPHSSKQYPLATGAESWQHQGTLDAAKSASLEAMAAWKVAQAELLCRKAAAMRLSASCLPEPPKPDESRDGPRQAATGTSGEEEDPPK